MPRTSVLKCYSVIAILIFVFLSGRLYQLQMVEGKHFKEMSERNAIRLVTVPAPRGILYDRNKKPVVASRMAYRVFVDIQEMAKLVPEPIARDKQLNLLTELLWPAEPGIPPAQSAAYRAEKRQELEDKINDPKRRAFEPVVPMNDADAATVSRILEHKAELLGVTVEEFPTRQYIHNRLASHLVGYLSEINATELSELRDKGYRMGDLIGKSGVEKVYEPYLRGKDGGLQVEVNNLGEPIRVLGTKPPEAGNDVVLTIDENLQAVAQKAFADHLAKLNAHDAVNAHGGAVVAMDPRNGQILAMASYPDFDPNAFVSSEMRKDVMKLFTDKRNPTMNRAIYGEYPYGSTFKMVTAVAALEEGKVDQYSRFYCNGYDPRYGKKCWTVGKGIIHGDQNLVDGIKNSCNIVFYELGRRLGADRIAKYARMMGFGKVTGIELPGERAGIVPDKAWKAKWVKAPWYPIESMDYAIGQGFMSGTPLQLARAYSAFLNGGYLYKPQIVKQILTPDGKVIKEVKPEVQGQFTISDKTRNMVKEGLREVVAIGTAKGAFRGFPIPAGGKTGTAQTPPADSHGWFMAFAPWDKPEIVVIVLTEHGKSGAGGAAPVARKVLEAYFGIKPVEKAAAVGPND